MISRGLIEVKYPMVQTLLPSGGLLLILMIGLLLFAGCTVFITRTPTTSTTSLPTTTFIVNSPPHILATQSTSIMSSPHSPSQQVIDEDIMASPPTCYFTPTQQATCLGWVYNMNEYDVQFTSIRLIDSRGETHQTTVLQSYIPALNRAPYHLLIPLETYFSLPELTITDIDYQYNNRIAPISPIQIDDIRIERHTRTIGYDTIRVEIALSDSTIKSHEKSILIITLMDEQERILSYRITSLDTIISTKRPYQIQFALTPHINADDIQAQVTLLSD